MKAAPSRPPPNGCSTTTTWSRSRSARSARTCRRSSIASCPSWTAGPFAGFPRVFGIAWAFVAHTDSRFEPETLRRFVRAYQSVEPLTIGELWAVAITLRIVLVENLRRVAQRIVTSRLARQEADAVADRLLGVNGQRVDPNALRNWRAKSPALKSGVRRAAGASAARPGSEDHARAALARRGTRGARDAAPNGCCRKNTCARALRTSRCATSSPACASCRTSTGPSSSRSVSLVDDALNTLARFRGHGFRHAQPVPQRHRRAGPRLEALGAGDRAAGAGHRGGRAPMRASAIRASI